MTDSRTNLCRWVLIGLLCSIEAATIQRLGLGAVLHEEIPIQLQTNAWRHVIMLPLPGKLEPASDVDPCRPGLVSPTAKPDEQHKSAEEVIKELCAGYEHVRDMGATLNATLTREINYGLETMEAVLRDAARTYQKPAPAPRGRGKRSNMMSDKMADIEPYSYAYVESGNSPAVKALRVIKEINKPSRSRSKRFIGPALSIWSHVTLERRMSTIETIVDQLADVDADMIVHLSEEIASVLNLLQQETNLTSSRFNQVRASIRNLTRAAQIMRKEVGWTVWLMSRWRAYTEYALIAHVQAYQVLQQYLTYVNRLSIGIHALTRGELSPQLISVRDLNQTLQVVQLGLLRNLPDYHIGLPRLEDLYHLPLEAVSMKNSVLYITLAIPIARTQDLFNVYRIQTFPMPAGENTTGRFTQLVNLPDYISIYGEYFVEMSHRDYSQCIGDLAIRTCFSRFVEHDFSQQTCALALFQNDVNAVTEKCEVHFIIQSEPLDILVPLGDDSIYVVALAEPGVWTVSCAGQRPSSEPSCVACEVQLPCQCGLRTTHTYIPAPLTGCKDQSSELMLQPPTYIRNLMYLYKVQGEINLKMMAEIFTANQSQALGPYLSLDDNLLEEEAELAAAQRRLELNIKQLSVDNKEDRLTWENDRAVKRRQLRNMARAAHTSSKHVGLTVVITTLILVGLIALVCVLTGKYKTLASSYAMLTSVPRVRAVDPSCPVVCQHITDHIPPAIEIMFMAAATVCLMIMIGKQMIKLYHRRHTVYRPSLWFPWAHKASRQTIVLLEVGNAKEHVVLDLQTLVGSPLRYRLAAQPISMQNMPGVRYKCNTLSHYLHIDWKSVKLIDDAHQQPVGLEKHVSVPFTLRQTTKRILSQPLSLRILIGSQGVFDSMAIVPDEEREYVPRRREKTKRQLPSYVDT